jgi:WD repeat-containing protein 42A
MKPFEFIVNGEDDCVRMYDKRKILHKPVKIFQPFLPTREVIS